jgi:hypothetical protein
MGYVVIMIDSTIGGFEAGISKWRPVSMLFLLSLLE